MHRFFGPFEFEAQGLDLLLEAGEVVSELLVLRGHTILLLLILYLG